MNFDRLMDYAHSLYNQYPVVIAVIALVLLFVACKKPKESFKFALLLLVMAAFFYAIGLFRDTLSTGTQNKDQMIHKTKGLDD